MTDPTPWSRPPGDESEPAEGPGPAYADAAPAGAQPFRDAPAIRLDTWPVEGGLVDDISAWFSIEWQFNGRSLGNVRISNIGTNDAVGWSLHVRAQIMDDNILYQPGDCAALRIRLHYRFSRSIGSDVLAQADVHLFGNGTMQHIAGELLLHEAPIRLVLVERADHIVAVRPGVVAGFVLVVSMSLAVVNDIQPVPRPALAVSG